MAAKKTKRSGVPKRVFDAKPVLTSSKEDPAFEMPTEPIPTAPRKVKQSYTKRDVQAQIAFVEALLYEPHLSAAAKYRACKEHHDPAIVSMGKRRLEKLEKRVFEQWSQEDEAKRASNKSAQVRRCFRHLAKARGEAAKYDDKKNLVQKERKPEWQSICRIEELLARIQGTLEPIKIDLSVTGNAATVHYISQMTEEQVRERLERYVAIKQLGEGVARRVLDAVGEEVKATG